MRIKRVVLENHCDVSILGLNIIHKLVADVQLAWGYFLKTCNHTQGGGFAAARGSYKDYEFLVLDVKVEFLNGNNALIGNLKINLLFFLALFGLLFLFCVGLDFLEVYEFYFCHKF